MAINIQKMFFHVMIEGPGVVVIACDSHFMFDGPGVVVMACDSHVMFDGPGVVVMACGSHDLFDGHPGEEAWSVLMAFGSQEWLIGHSHGEYSM